MGLAVSMNDHSDTNRLLISYGDGALWTRLTSRKTAADDHFLSPEESVARN